MHSSAKQRRISKVRALARAHSRLDDGQLKREVAELRKKIQTSKDAEAMAVDAFAILDVAVQRHLGMSAYDVQLSAAFELTRRSIVEMATGEGKTLTALYPLFYRALQGKGVLLATANDYLAARDAEFAATVFTHLDVTVGWVVDSSDDGHRAEAYRKQITYGTASQFGFDFLRDRAKARFNRRNPGLPDATKVQRDRLFAVIVDEVDSLLIDEAATPLIISSAPPPLGADRIAAIQWAGRMAPQAIETQHYRYKKIEKTAELTNLGKMWVHQNLQLAESGTLSMIDLYEIMEKAINVHRDFISERNYIISDQGEILLIDQSTGRIGEGRQWSEGIHQAIQAKENLPITSPRGHLARVTLQSFFLSFENLSGMTGTASSAAREFKKIYKIGISKVPPRRPNQRVELPPRCFKTNLDWLNAIVSECRRMIKKGRSVLIGTRNVRLSEQVSTHLKYHNLNNQLLNARHDQSEATIVGQAGQSGRITVATNMAGRGTDIELSPDVKSAGGLHVILGGLHESRRIDRQLLGRAARQGDPGSYRIMLSLEDDLIDAAFTGPEASMIRKRLLKRFSEQDCLAVIQQAQAAITKRSQTSRMAFFYREKKQLKHLARAGIDPLLDFPQ